MCPQIEIIPEHFTALPRIRTYTCNTYSPKSVTYTVARQRALKRVLLNEFDSRNGYRC